MNKKYYFIIGLLALILLTTLYMFYFKPRQARKECGQVAETKARQDYFYTQEDFRLEDYNKHFKACITQKGYDS